jgi:hypothetical protein
VRLLTYYLLANREGGIQTDDAYFKHLRAWLKRCDDDHKCKGTIAKDSMPTRVIDIGLEKNDLLTLRDSNQINTCSYVALSHCWGEYQAGEKERICTHAKNLNDRKRGFQVETLPKTFQDAVEVTRQLGQQYLWIDSICIEQSLDKTVTEDWKQESERMEIIFSSAYCTLAASLAKRSSDGFLRQRPSIPPLQIETEGGDYLYVSAEIGNFLEDTKVAPLNTRGWVLQERILSRRTIHFCEKQTYFECGKRVDCENFISMRR